MNRRFDGHSDTAGDAQRARVVARCAIRMETLAQLSRELEIEDVLRLACDLLADAMPIARATLTIETNDGPEIHTWRRRNAAPELTRICAPMDERRGVSASVAFDLDAPPPADAKLVVESFVLQLSHALSRVRSLDPCARSGTHVTVAAVLLVEDDHRVARAIQDLLELDGHAVRRAANGEEALTMMRIERPRVVLLDVNMPVMDGREFRRRQLADERLRDVPVIVTSAHFDGGFDDGVTILGKPFALRELHAALAAVDERDVGRRLAPTGA